MMRVELRSPEPASGFGGTAADLSLVELLAGGTSGAVEAQPRSFGDELDDSLQESEADHEPPACTACPATPLPLVGVLRAFGPPIDLSGFAGKAAAEVTPASKNDDDAAAIPAHSSVTAPADAGVASGVASDAPEMDVAFVTKPGVDAAVQPAGRDGVRHDQLPPETPGVVSGATAAKPSSDAERQGVPLAGHAQERGQASTGPAPASARDSGQENPGPAPGPTRDSGQTNAGPVPGPTRDSGQTTARPERVPTPDRPQTTSVAAENRISDAPADAPEQRFVAGERLPMAARPGATDLTDSGGAGIDASAPKHSTDASPTPRASADPGDDSRRLSAAHRSPAEPVAVEGRTGAAPSATPEGAFAGRERPWQPLPHAESAPAFEDSPRPAVEAGIRMVPAAPSPPAPQVTATQPVVQNVEAPRVPVAPDTADSIVQSMRLQYQRGGGDAVVQIKPEHLGPVSISLRVENGAVSAVVHAESGEVAEWLKSNEQLLREGLASSGLHLERFAVRRDGHPPDRRPWRPPEPPERRRRSLQPESTFEISV